MYSLVVDSKPLLELVRGEGICQYLYLKHTFDVNGNCQAVTSLRLRRLVTKGDRHGARKEGPAGSLDPPEA